jgi:hypothetical protein
MMNELQAFWVSRPPDPTMSFDLWRGFRSEVFGWLVFWVLAGAALIIGLYMWQSRKLTVRSPRDPFARFVPMRWLWLSALPGIVTGVIYAALYAKTFPTAAVGSVGGAVSAAGLATLSAFAIAQVAMWLPGVTPRKFLYHPRWPWRLFARRRA